jgi:hypothetical protein
MRRWWQLVSSLLAFSAFAVSEIVPVGDNGMAVYQVGDNGTAKLKTVLIAH